MAVTRREIGDLLVDNGVLTPEELDIVRAERAQTGDSIATVLARLGLAGESQLKNTLELEFGVNFVFLSKYPVDTSLLHLLSEDVVREHLVIPISSEGNRLIVAMVDPSDGDAVEAVKICANGMTVKTMVCLEDDFYQFVRENFKSTSRATAEMRVAAAPGPDGSAKPTGTNGSAEHSEAASRSVLEDTGSLPRLDETLLEQLGAQSARALASHSTESRGTEGHSPETDSEHGLADNPDELFEPELPEESEPEIHSEIVTGSFPTVTEEEAESHAAEFEATRTQDLSELDLARRAQEEAIVLLANQILGGAIKRHCSNIHITPGDRQAMVQYRQNGQLYVDRRLPNTILTALIARYKMMARMSLSETKVPQDGHIKVKSSSKEIVCLVSTVPTESGEHVVIWIV